MVERAGVNREGGGGSITFMQGKTEDTDLCMQIREVKRGE